MHTSTEVKPPWETNEAWRAAIARQPDTGSEIELATAAAVALTHMSDMVRLDCLVDDLPSAAAIVQVTHHQPTNLERQIGLIAAKIRTEVIARCRLEDRIRVNLHLSVVEQAFVESLLSERGYAVEWGPAPATLDVDPGASDEASCRDITLSAWIPPSILGGIK